MNPNLSLAAIHACLEVLYRGLVHVRNAASAGDVMRAEAIADALHNLPHLLSRGDQCGWDLPTFRTLFLEPLIDRYPTSLASCSRWMTIGPPPEGDDLALALSVVSRS